MSATGIIVAQNKKESKEGKVRTERFDVEVEFMDLPNEV